MAAVTGAAIGLASTGISTVMSFTQAAKQQQLYRQANAKAEQAMQEARKKLEVNYMDQLSIMKEPYELQREAMLVQGAQSLEAAREADRGAAPTAGRLQAMQNEQQAGIRTAMGQELMGLEKLSADEESRLRDINVQLDIGEIQGAQLAAADAQQARSAAMTQGFQGLTQMAGYAAEMVPLYMQSAAGKELDTQMAEYSKAAAAGTLDARFKTKDGKYMPFQQAIGEMYGQDFSTMPADEFGDYMRKKRPKDIRKAYNPRAFQFTPKYEPGVGVGILQPKYLNPQDINPLNPFGF
jgi:hypothetical protein